MNSAVTPLVTIVIPTYGRSKMVDAAVKSALAQDYDADAYEVIVVDSSPTDDVRKTVEQLRRSAGERLRYAWKEPEGPGPSRNLGTRLGSGRVVAFLDSDCRATPEWIRHGVAAFEEGVGLVQGAVLPDPTARRSVFTHYLAVEEESFLYETANMFYRREALDQSGGFRADLTPTADRPMGGEDVDLAWRVKRLGWRSRFAPTALVYHEVVPIPVWRWIVVKRLYVFPLLTKRNPEVRRFCYHRYFYDRAQCLLALGLLGVVCASATPWTLALCLPYVVARASEPTATLNGFKRPLRVAAYFLRDVASFGLLLAGSIRYRSVLL
jgi:glycosyltransferase involved in cell wall biosynthesis